MSGKHPAHVFRDRLHGRGDLPPVGQLPGATPARVAVALALANYADTHGVASPGFVILGRLCACDPRTVRRALEWLEAQGLVRRGDGGHRGRASEYRLLTGKGDTRVPLSGRKGGQIGGQPAGRKGDTGVPPTSGTSRGAGGTPLRGGVPQPDSDWDPLSVRGSLALAPRTASPPLSSPVARRRLEGVATRQGTRQTQMPGQRTLPLWVAVPVPPSVPLGEAVGGP